jgi:hypothetical protein
MKIKILRQFFQDGVLYKVGKTYTVAVSANPAYYEVTKGNKPEKTEEKPETEKKQEEPEAKTEKPSQQRAKPENAAITNKDK